jgi:hypothetical protein
MRWHLAAKRAPAAQQTNPNKSRNINRLRLYCVQNQRVFQKRG